MNSIVKRFTISISLLFLLMSTLSLLGQDKAYAEYIIETLCSEDFHGRGYVEDGHHKAAEFISEQFDSLGLEPLDDSFYQYFQVSANTFPSTLELDVNGKRMEVGSEWLIDPASSSFSGISECVYISKPDLGHRKSQKQIKKAIKKNQAFVVSDMDRAGKMALATLKNSFEKIKIIELVEKPMWHISANEGDDLHIKIVEDKIKEPIRTIEYTVEAKYRPYIKTQNVIGFIPSAEPSDSFFVFSAHYDHLGRMGEHAYTPGANDNASGTSMLLNLARHYSLADNRPQNHNILFIAFGAEEIGLKGAYHFVKKKSIPLEQIKFLLNLDIVGTGDDGIQVVNSKIFTDAFEKLTSINEEKKYVKEIKLRGEAANSDHYPFYEKDVPCFFIYTLGGVMHYHDVFDRFETLPLTDYEDLFKLITEFENSF